jgi:protein-S-isoprenylcysteine O-methyltransferase Ste14
MYLAMALIGLGISIWVNSLTMVLMILVFVGIINYYVIKREECYLEAKFGDEYNNYRHRTRRWI